MEFRRRITSVDHDSAGIQIVHDQPYNVEWLRRNHAVNGGFEDWTSTDPTNWTCYGFAKDITVYRSGSISAKSNAGASGNDLISAFIPINPQKTYRLSAYFCAPSAVLTLPDVADIVLEFYDSSQSLVKVRSYNLQDVAATWGLVSNTYYPGTDIPGSSRYALIYIRAAPGPFMPSIFVDDVCLSVNNPLSIINYSDFAVLKHDDEETFTFPESAPLIGTELANSDDPTIVMESDSGYIRIEQTRSPRRDFSIKIRLYSREALQQLRRFHAKVRRTSFIYQDENGIDYEVLWRGGFNPPAIYPQDVYVVTIPLTFLTITPGE